MDADRLAEVYHKLTDAERQNIRDFQKANGYDFADHVNKAGLPEEIVDSVCFQVNVQWHMVAIGSVKGYFDKWIEWSKDNGS